MNKRFRETFFLAFLALLFSSVHASFAGDPTTLVFLTWKPSQPEVWNGLIHKFHRQHPGIRVRVQVGPHSSTAYHAILTQRLKNKDPSVDVFFMDVIWPAEFANAGWLSDLSARFSPSERLSYLPGPIEANTYRGKIHGVPCFIGAGLFYYRKDLLDKYGFKRPRHWREMLDQGRTVLKGEGEPGLHIYSAQFKQYEGLVCDMLEFIWSNGGAVLEAHSGRIRLAEPPAVQAVAFVRDEIIGKAAPMGALNYEEPESLSFFLQGKAVFHRNWPYAWSLANDVEESKITGKIGVGSLPAFEGNSPASTLGGWQFGISRWSRHPDAAWQFIEFMSSYDSQKTLALKASLAPTRRDVYEDPQVEEKMPHLRAFLPVFERARPRPITPLYPMISQELQRFFSRAIVDKGADISELAESASGRIKKLVKLGESIKP